MNPTDTAAPMKQAARLWSKTQPSVAALVVGAVADFHDAEDLVAEVAETVIAKFGDYDQARPFAPWAMGIARKLILRYYERRAGEKFLPFDTNALDAVVAAHAEMSEEIPVRLIALRGCIQGVRGKARRVLDLHYGRGMKPEAVADALDMTRNAVWVTLHRVRVALKNCIEQKLAATGEIR